MLILRSVRWLATALLLLLALLLPAETLAQTPPQVEVDSTTVDVGEEVALRATGLEPEGEYRLTLEGPESDGLQETLIADGSGELEHTFELPRAGEWTLLLSGEGISGSLKMQANEAATGTAATEEAAAQPTSEADGEAANAAPEEAETRSEDAGADEPTATEENAPEDTPTEDTAPEDTAAEDTAPENTAAEDTAAEDTVTEDTAAEDTAAEDSAGADTDAEDTSATEDSSGPAATARQDSTEGAANEQRADENQSRTTRQSREISVTTEGDAVVGSSGDRTVWRFDFPEDSGGTGAVLETEETVWIGHGASLLRVDRETGRALERHPLPGRVIRLENGDDAVSAVSDIDGNLRQRIEIGPDGPNSTVRFGIDTERFEWLRNEAVVPDQAARLEQDPTNPWLHLALGLDTRDVGSRAEHLDQALERADTFYDLAGIARELKAAGENEYAREAMDLALRDFAERGYTPRLLTNAELHRAYDFPLAPMEQALAQDDMEAASFWAPWLYLVSSEDAPETRAALAAYADSLGAAGQRDAENLWRDRSRAGRSSSPAASLDRFFLGLGRSGWYAVAALLAAIVALHLTLTAKYWAPQTLAIKRSRETGSSRKPWARLLAIRYYSFIEKLVLVLLFAACLVLLGLTRWHDSSGTLPAALGSGTLASPVARDLVTSRPLEGPRAAFIRGYAAHVAGERSAAQNEYRTSDDYPPALNNLAALLDDDVLYQRALELAPGMPEASYNLGRSADPSPFHASYQEDEPLLAVPTDGDFRTAASGTWQSAIGSSFRNPWRALSDMEFFGAPALLWQFLLALFLLWGLVTVVWMLVPRPALARNAPRTATYHLLALLIPGSGLADEAWGVLLMVPWALLGVDALAQVLGWNRSLGLPLTTELWALGAIYLVNLVAFVVEFVSYRKRMHELRRRNPESVEAYGLRP